MSGMIVARLKGGLGNQLFAYAAARRLALVSDAELVLDDITGFERDTTYRRQYALDPFNIPVRRATARERLEPFGRWRRAGKKLAGRYKRLENSGYIAQTGMDFDERILSLRVQGHVYMDGLWQSEGYFKDVEQTIREDLRITPPRDPENARLAERILSDDDEAVAIHVRWFSPPGRSSSHNVDMEYYRRAVSLIEGKVACPHYLLFSDEPEAARKQLDLPVDRVTAVEQNQGPNGAYADLWLMSLCQHFVIANSTFGWWGAWLAEGWGKIVVAPGVHVSGLTAWGFSGLIPDGWYTI